MLGSDKLNIQAKLSCIAVKKVGIECMISKLLGERWMEWKNVFGQSKRRQEKTENLNRKIQNKTGHSMSLVLS